MKVADIMAVDVASVGPRMALKDVAATLLERRISGVPVVDDAGRVLGVLSETDILQKELGKVHARSRLGGRFRNGHGDHGEIQAKVEATNAGEAMSSPPVAVRPKASITEAAALMLDHHVNRLVVIDDGQVDGPVGDGPLVGLITRADLVRAFARPDAEVAGEVARMMVSEMGIPPSSVVVDVRGGEVTMQGHLDSRTTVEVLNQRVREVPGVVSVDSNVTWRDEEHADRRDDARVGVPVP
jgi:CBS domain-containing protein